MSLNFSKEIYDDVVVEIIELTRATLQEAQEFKNILSEDINKNYLKFVVDLKECEFIDSTFLSTLVTTLKSLLSKGGNIKLSSVNSEVQSLLELTGTNHIFEIFKTRSKAVKSYSNEIKGKKTA
ncbi:MAG: STAS domain-containing protein [Ignavibacteriaceae bacterium]